MMISDPEEILEAVVEALGLQLASHELLRETVSGDGIVRGYRVDVSDQSGETRSEVLYLQTSVPKPRSTSGVDTDNTNAENTTADGVLVFRNAETDDEVAVWLYPRDPALPALQTAVYPEAAAIMLHKMGIPAHGLQLELAAYRPGRRAVVKATTNEQTLYLKVVRPQQIETLHGLYAQWSEAELPVPRTLGWSRDGLIGFSELPGRPALDVVDTLDEQFIDEIERLIAKYHAIESTHSARTSLAERVDWYARRVAARHTPLASRASALGQRITSARTTLPPAEQVTIHGDLHLAQVFVDPASTAVITGILDIDTAGLGDPADDAGALYAHLIVSEMFEQGRERDASAEAVNASAEAEAGTGAGRSTHFMRVAQLWRARWQPYDYAQRAATVAATHLLAHTLGDFAPAEDLLNAAEQLLTDFETPESRVHVY